MRVAVIADIHGNYRALEAVLADIDQQDAGEIISLGDNVGYGPEPEKVVQVLRKRQVVSVMGNHEFGLVSESYFKRLNPGGPRESLILTRELLGEDSLRWLAALPPFLLHHGARFVHGCPPQSITAYLFSPTTTRLARIFSNYKEQICFAGHTHTLNCYTQREQSVGSTALPIGLLSLASGVRYLILSGSVGQPRDGINSQAKYCIWDREQKSVEVRGVDYDVDTTVALLNELGFPKSNALRL